MYRQILVILTILITAMQLGANALKFQESPYLQQHADNPVDWMPWSKEAFIKAKKQKKMIFLSIGYSTCHWCHVMEGESFENKKFAKFLNKYFVPIKVDREEMPQIDSYYQKVYQVMNGRGGGWPLTILMTADKKVFFSGTYIPLKARYGSMGLWDLLKKVVALRKNNPQKLADISKSIESLMKQVERVGQQQKGSLKESRLEQTFQKNVALGFDSKNGGIGNAPKFPQASTIITLLTIYSVNHNKGALDMADSMLDHMAKGGIYDQIEGGFYRYSTDAEWKIPHFEKMLYTNAELLEAYTLAYKITHKKLYKKVIDETIALLKEKYQYKGLYFGASDADSMNKEGKKEEGYYYVYSEKEALDALQKAKIAQSKKILEHLGISWEGNFHNGLSNPFINSKISVDSNELAKAKSVLKKLRKKRKYPFIDKKLLTAWNALLAHGIYTAGDSKDAKVIVDKLLQKLYINKTLYHQMLPGKEPKVKAVMEDYAFMIMALLDSYQATQEPKYLQLAQELTTEAQKRFDSKGVWYNSDDAYKSPLSITDGSYRNALAVMGENFLRLEILTENLKFGQEAKKILNANANVIKMGAGNASGVRLAIAQKRGYIIVTAQKEQLAEIKKRLRSATNYPFIAYKSGNTATITACKRESCFASDKTIDGIAKKITEQIKQAKSRKSSKSIKF